MKLAERFRARLSRPSTASQHDTGGADDPTVRRPRLHLTVGVTGHRNGRLDTSRQPEFEMQLRNLLQAVAAAAAATQQAHHPVFSAAAPCLRLLSALAEGADTLAARAALEAGWRLDVCLPFAPALCEADFPQPASRTQFSALLAQATAVFALAGSRNATDAAYEAAGRVMLEQSDIVFALWDGDSARGRGGTAQIIEEAVARHVPVVHLDARGTSPPMVLWSGLSSVELEQPTLGTVPRAPAIEVLGAVTEALTIPPDNDVDRRMLARFFKERSRKRSPALPYPLLLMFAGIRRMRAADWRPPQPAECAQHLRVCLIAAPDTGLHGDALQNRLLPEFGVADAAASYYAQVFRSSFVANFGLAALAVLLAALGLIIPAAKLPLIAAELVLVIVILTNTRAGRRAGWHERWMDDRHLAEQLRVTFVSSMLGDLDLRGSEARDAALVPGWVRWLSRATAREIGLPGAIVNNDYLAKLRTATLAMIADQIEYHRSNAARIDLLDHRLHRMGEYLFGGTIMACIAWLTLALTGAMQAVSHVMNLTAIVTAVTAVLPALGASLYGIRMQGDFAGIAGRATVIVKRLERLQRAIESDALEFTRQRSRLRRLSDIMLTDVSSWRTTYQARPLTLPG